MFRLYYYFFILKDVLKSLDPDPHHCISELHQHPTLEKEPDVLNKKCARRYFLTKYSYSGFFILYTTDFRLSCKEAFLLLIQYKFFFLISYLMSHWPVQYSNLLYKIAGHRISSEIQRKIILRNCYSCEVFLFIQGSISHISRKFRGIYCAFKTIPSNLSYFFPRRLEGGVHGGFLPHPLEIFRVYNSKRWNFPAKKFFCTRLMKTSFSFNNFFWFSPSCLYLTY